MSTRNDGRLRSWLEPSLLFLLAALAVAPFVVRVALRLGSLEFPLDDPYIYLQYARNLAAGRLFEYWPGDGYTAGCTSAFYPLLLVPGFWAGLRDAQMVSYVFGLSFVLIWLSTWLAARIGRLYGGRLGAVLAVGMLLSTGSWLWGALSGLEIGLFTVMSLLGVWLLARDAEVEGAGSSRAPRTAPLLWLTAALLGVARPEGVSIAVVLIGCALLREGRRGQWRSWLVWPLALGPWLAVGLLNQRFAGHFVPNTAVGKSVMFFPRQSLWKVVIHAGEQLEVLGGRLLLGQYGRWYLALGILPVVVALGWTAGRAWRELRGRRAFPATFFLLSLAGGVASALTARGPGQFHRYYHHVFALAAVAGGIGLASIWNRLRLRLMEPGPRRSALVTAGVASLIFLTWSGVQLSRWSELFAQASSEIRGQQVKVARWMDRHLPGDAYVLLNDVGAMTYLAHRRSFDIVGLTTNFQASSFLEGPGALFEGLERLPPAARPGYLAVYPEWLELPFLLGRELFRATLPRYRVVAGGRSAAVFEADWKLLGSGSMPALPLPAGRVLDALDVADLVDESAHGYRLEVPDDARGARNTTLLTRTRQVGLWAGELEAPVEAPTPGGKAAALTSGDSVATVSTVALPISSEPSPPTAPLPVIVDGGRRVRVSESFEVNLPEVRTAGLRMRIEAVTPTRIDLLLDGAAVGSHTVPVQKGFVEVDLELPGLAGHPGRHRIEARLGSGPNYRIFHYWVWGE